MAAASLRVLLVYPASDMPAGIESVLRRHGRIAKLGSAHSLKEVPGLIRRERYDVVLLDDDDPAVDTAVPEQLRRIFPHVRVALLTSMQEPTPDSKAGAEGYPVLLRKGSSEKEFLESVNRFLDRTGPGMPGLRPAGKPGSEANTGDSIRGRAGLSRREFEVYGLLHAGLTDKDIAARLGLSMQTIRQHHKSLKRKLAIAGLLDTLE